MNRHDAPCEEPAEHLRFAAHLNEPRQVADLGEAAPVGSVLTDRDQAMARSAVLRHLDRRAGALHLGPASDRWAESMAQATAGDPFLAARLREWPLLRAIALRRSWDRDAPLASSGWLQREAAAASDAEAVELLAEHGRTRRTRTTARARLEHGQPH
ncbi:hypothetical protein GCM10010266_14690 [Streptomyces griseomycini]|uniref:hypothetical protein n=1 Tax=Streptomyces griseomycini TaxID=66895 RepID=UPI0018746162|nr:hypothetical protein [Streptomyces griseomycini]GGP93031.1 hypothetical protein GCM10010266_14690 [Streptomyces griseomycini]